MDSDHQRTLRAKLSHPEVGELGEGVITFGYSCAGRFVLDGFGHDLALTEDQLAAGLLVVADDGRRLSLFNCECRRRRQRSEEVPPYIVPLSAQALEIVRRLLDGMEPRQRYLLAQRSDVTKPISENTLNNALKSLGFAGRLTGHGIRATLATALNELEYPTKWIEAQLSHADPDGSRGVYNHAMYVEQRAHMMQDWADRLYQLEQAGDFVTRPILAKALNAPTGRELVQCGNVTHMASGTAVTLTAIPVTAAVSCSVNALQHVPVSASHSLGYCSLLICEAPTNLSSLA